MSRAGLAREALALPQNEPINWLLGRALTHFIDKDERVFILDALAVSNSSAVRAWNAWIAEFRNVITNRDDAVRKADEELCKQTWERLETFMTEVLSVLRLSRLGYTDFEVVLADKIRPSVDFIARGNGKRVRIEVKRLQEPQDIIRTVASARWAECRINDPAKFNFQGLLSHSYHGALSATALSKLHNVIDQLPQQKAGVERTIALDSDISIRVVCFGADRQGAPRPGYDVTSKDPSLVIRSAFRAEDLDFDLPELQGLFVKTLRTIGEAANKFFGRHSDADWENIFAIEWKAPKVIYDPATLGLVGQAIEKAFEAVDLNLKVLIFAGDVEPNYKFLEPTPDSNASLTVEISSD